LTYRNVTVSQFAYHSLGVARRQFVEYPLSRINGGRHQATATINTGNMS
jgi:hypothetical protein